MRIFSSLRTATCLWALWLGISFPAAAQEANRLVTIRFNKPNVTYQNALYQAIAQAVQTKPSVTFDLVSVAPQTGDTARDAQWQRAAGTHAKAVLASMVQMGIPQSRIAVRGMRETGLRHDEVRILVH